MIPTCRRQLPGSWSIPTPQPCRRSYRRQPRTRRRPWDGRPKLRKVESDPSLLAAVNAGLAQQCSPRWIWRRLVPDHPDRPELRVSHEALYQALYCQARGQLRVELLPVRRGRNAGP
jgi:IS30 family transposase